MLVDVENLSGCNPSEADADLLTSTVGHVRDRIVRRGDKVIVGCNPWLTARIALAWPTCPMIVALSGKNGADRALIAEATDARLNAFDRAVILSGDGSFVTVAQRARRFGKAVHVIARAGQLHTALRTAADRVALWDLDVAPKSEVAR